ncbi:MAG: hypothetical protein COV45_08250 [Deltaproteobacteria bacterium CG11_big_fil_rev_8_21_14_0_20_47_16]|nr:MAG: hypothetical protein COV45_08250 [Deltaproteobacteria bacterium CG11_big_fil_rev_8_21_14_0_20_47_16]
MTRMKWLWVIVIPLVVACSGASDSSGAGGDGGTDSGVGSEGVASGQCSESVSVAQESESEEDCTTIAIFINLQAQERLLSITKLLGEAAATGLGESLKRASVISNTDVATLVAYLEMVQLLGGDDDGSAALRIAESYSNADILVTMAVSGDPNGLMSSRLSAYDKKNNRSLGSVGVSGDATRLAKNAQSMGVNLAEKIKEARVCLSLTPVRAVIDFDKESKRQQTFTMNVKNLKNENVDDGEVSFELSQPDWGTLSRSSSRVSGGTADTVFTMTKKKPNLIKGTYKNDFTTQEDESVIMPLCGWLLTIEGNKVFDLNHASPPLFHALFGDGAWITINGENTVSGRVPLAIEDDGITVFGVGWLTEKHDTSGAVFTYIRSDGGIIGECSSKSSINGLASGDWLVWGTVSDDKITIQGLGSGIAPNGETGSGKCTLAGLSAGGGGSKDTGLISEFHDVTLPLEAGASASTSGQGALFEEKYNYTLTLKRAAP